MSELITKFLDPYDRPARLYPGLLVVAPLAVLLVCVYGTNSLALSVVVSILASCGVAYAIGRIARDAGKRIQNDLYTKWGGAPTVQLLRHRDAHFDSHTKERFHSVISKGLGKKMPSTDSERLDPVAADELYRAATIWLIDQTRDTKVYPLVFKENVAYGFHRNALGIRRLGIAVAFLCIIWALLSAKVLLPVPPFVDIASMLEVTPFTIVTVAVAFSLVLSWVFLLTEGAAKRAGIAYAERLLQSCDRIKPASLKGTSVVTRK